MQRTAGEADQIQASPGAFGVERPHHHARVLVVQRVEQQADDRAGATIILQWAPRAYCKTLNSMRRFFSRPAAFLLSAIGSSAPAPRVLSLSGPTPLSTSHCFTASARSWDRRWLTAGSPSLEVWPEI